MEKKWIVKGSPKAAEVEKLAAEIKVDPYLAALLVQRGYRNFLEAKDFFRPSLKHLHDPFLMKDMDKAVARIQSALKRGEKILVYGDYDVDGTTAVSLVYQFLKDLGAQAATYIPDRYEEGYGISYQGIDYAKQEGYSLIIALDCGIKAVEKIAYAQEKGIDFIVCDHHTPGPELPPAIAILDPKRSDCPYPYKELCGCGVGFKLMQALAQAMGLSLKKLYPYLDLLAVSIGADIVPMTGENRILMYFGLKKLNRQPLPGLEALLKESNFEGPHNSRTVVFGIAPRINASGRMAHASDALDLLCEKDIRNAAEKARKIEAYNQQRKQVDQNITAEALESIATHQGLENAFSTVLFNENWHKGVIGIVASRCIEHYYRPTIILTASNNKITGSARSVTDFDVYEAIASCSDLLEQFGGHKYAAGLTLDPAKLTAFSERFERVVSQSISPDLLLPRVGIDLEIPLSALTFKFERIIQQMGPFGPGNLRPVFCSKGLCLQEEPKILKEKHLKLVLGEEGKGRQKRMTALGWNLAFEWGKEKKEKLRKGDIVDLAFTVETNVYQGEKRLQLIIKDIKKHADPTS